MVIRYRKILALLLACLQLMLLSACADSNPAAKNDLSETASTQSTETAQQTAVDMTAACAQTLISMVPEPSFGSVGGEWSVIGLTRWGGELPENWTACYWNKLCDHVSGCNGILHERKYTEYSRVILAVTAIGKDPTDVGGYNMLLPLADFEQTVFQGVNGPVYALLALDSGNYEIPANTAGSTQATRELYVDYILSMESASGGWSLAGGDADVDITAMTLQALAKYRERPDVADAVERALVYLSDQQNELGGYTAYNAESSESVSQAIVALTALGTSPEDSRFVKNGNTLLDALLRFRQADGGFSHLMGGESDLLATEQAFYALVAADRLARGESSLYNMK